MNIRLPLTMKITIDKASVDAPFIAYSPELDVVSCGSTEKKAKQNLHEVIEITLEAIEKKGKLVEFLEELGFQKEKKGWVPPRISFEPFSFTLSV